MTTLTIDGREYVAVPIERWKKIPAKWRMQITPDNAESFRRPDGDYDAIGSLRASIARDVLQGRLALGWSQRQLAAAGIRQATVANVESGSQTPNIRTIEKIESALAQAGNRSA